MMDPLDVKAFFPVVPIKVVLHRSEMGLTPVRFLLNTETYNSASKDNRER